MPNDEFDWINERKPTQIFQERLEVGIGDDAAVYRPLAQMNEIVCVDTMIEDVHFRKDTMNPFDIGFKALAANISDVAAMGGVPHFYVISIAVTPSWSEEELNELYRGMNELGARYHMDMIGGDTVSSRRDLMVSITVIGAVEEKQQLLRSSAEPGDIVFLTGPVGMSAAGLELLLERTKDAAYSEREQALIAYHQRPVPQVEAGRLLVEYGGRTALNDISDGLASECCEIAEASDVSIELDFSGLPVHEAMEQLEMQTMKKHMFYGGEDFELVGTAPSSVWEELSSKFRKAGLALYAIGKVSAGNGEVFLQENGSRTRLEKSGYNHFRSS